MLTIPAVAIPSGHYITLMYLNLLILPVMLPVLDCKPFWQGLVFVILLHSAQLNLKCLKWSSWLNRTSLQIFEHFFSSPILDFTSIPVLSLSNNNLPPPHTSLWPPSIIWYKKGNLLFLMQSLSCTSAVMPHLLYQGDNDAVKITTKQLH